jgi:hypothetical protein
MILTACFDNHVDYRYETTRFTDSTSSPFREPGPRGEEAWNDIMHGTLVNCILFASSFTRSYLSRYGLPPGYYQRKWEARYFRFRCLGGVVKMRGSK